MPGAADIRAGGAFVELYADDAALQQGLSAAQRRLRGFANSVQAIGRSMFAGGLTASFFGGISANTFATFEKSMLAVRGITGSTNEEFANLSATAARLGRETSFTALEIAESMTEFARAGASAETIAGSMGSVLNLARGTMTDLGEATRSVVNIMGQFGLDVDSAARITDVLAIAANKSVQTVEDLSEAFAYAGVVAADAGESLESTAAFMGVLANVGLRASNAGTQLRRVLYNLAKAATRERLADFGIDVTDAQGNFAGLGKLMDELRERLERFGNADATSIMEELFGRGTVAAKVLGRNSEQILEFLSAFENMRGEAGRLRDEMESGLGGAIERTKSAFEGLQLSIGGAIRDELIETLNALNSIQVSVAEWIDKNKQLVTTIAKVAVGFTLVGAGLVAVGLGSRVLATLISGFQKLVAVGGRVGSALNQGFLTALPYMKLMVSTLDRARLSVMNLYKGVATLGGAWRYTTRSWFTDVNQYIPKEAVTRFRALGNVLLYTREMAERVWLAMRNVAKGTNSVASQFRYLQRANTSLMKQFILTESTAARMFDTIHRGARTAGTALKAIGGAIAGGLLGAAIFVVVDAILSAVKATWDWVRGVTDLTHLLDGLEKKDYIGDKYDLSMAAAAFTNLGDTIGRTEEQTNRLMDSAAMLEREYGDLGIVFDEATGRIQNFEQVLLRLQSSQAGSMKVGRSIGKIMSDLNTVQAEIDRVEDGGSKIGRTFNFLSGGTSDMVGLTGPGASEDEIDRLYAARDKLLTQLAQYGDESTAVFAGENRKLQEQIEKTQALQKLREMEAKQPKDNLQDFEARIQIIKDLRKMEDEAALETKRVRIKAMYDGHEEQMRLLNLEYQDQLKLAKGVGFETPELARLFMARKLAIRLEANREAEEKASKIAARNADLEIERQRTLNELKFEDAALKRAQFQLDLQEARKVAVEQKANLTLFDKLWDAKRRLMEQGIQEEEDRDAEKALRKRQDQLQTIAEIQAEINLFGQDDALARRQLELQRKAAIREGRRNQENIKLIKQEFALREKLLKMELKAENDEKKTRLIEKQREAAEALAETLRPDSLGATFQGRLAPLILGEGGVQKDQLEALKKLLEVQKEALDELGQIGGAVGGGIPGI